MNAGPTRFTQQRKNKLRNELKTEILNI